MYTAKRDGIVNEDEITAYILFRKDNTQVMGWATEHRTEFQINTNDIYFWGDIQDFENFLENNGYKYYGKVIDGNKATRIHIKAKETDNRVIEAKKLTLDFFS